MPEIYKKIAACKEIIRNTKVKEAGYNSFSKYDYFLPEQINEMVADACKDQGLMTKFDLIRNETGVYGTLQVIEIETGENVEYMMATDIPVMKATNAAQQLGGAMTYTHRYLKMSAFDISNNTLDFDTDTKKESKSEKKEYAKKDEITSWMSEKNFNQIKEALESNDTDKIKKACDYYKDFSTAPKGMKGEYRKELKKLIPNETN